MLSYPLGEGNLGVCLTSPAMLGIVPAWGREQPDGRRLVRHGEADTRAEEASRATAKGEVEIFFGASQPAQTPRQDILGSNNWK